MESLEIDFKDTNAELVQEIQILSSLNVDGIITTNWDKLIESIYPEYKVFIGQD